MKQKGEVSKVYFKIRNPQNMKAMPQLPLKKKKLLPRVKYKVGKFSNGVGVGP